MAHQWACKYPGLLSDLPGGPYVGAPELGPGIGLHFGVRIISQEVLKDELQKLKSQQSDLRKAMRQNRKEARNANKRKKRLVKALWKFFGKWPSSWHQGICVVATSWVVFVFEAAKMLSAEDLKILVAAKEARMLLEALLCSAPSVFRQLLQRPRQQTRLGRRLRVIARSLVIFLHAGRSRSKCACRAGSASGRLFGTVVANHLSLLGCSDLGYTALCFLLSCSVTATAVSQQRIITNFLAFHVSGAGKGGRKKDRVRNTPGSSLHGSAGWSLSVIAKSHVMSDSW